MIRIQVHPDELEKNARLLQQSKQQLGKILYELDKDMYLLQSEWSGVTSEKFFWDFMNIKESVFPSALGLLDKFQNKLQETASLFRSTDSSGVEVLRLPEELGPSFATGLIDKAIGDTVTGMGETLEAFIYSPFSTLGSLTYAMTVGKIVDVGRGVGFAWDAAWGTGTARSDIEQFVNEQKKQLGEDESGYYKGAVIGQALSYFLFGKALHSKDHHGSGGSSRSGEGKNDPEKENGKEGRDSVIPEKVDWSKYKRIDNYQPTFETIFDEANYRLASRHYEEIKSVGMKDIDQVAKNTGLSRETISTVKQHIFFDSHKIPLNDKNYRVGQFTPDADFGYAWKQAQKERELTQSQKEWLQQMIKHELTEIELMKQGYPYKNPDAYNPITNSFGPRPPGAHDAADPQPKGEFEGAFSYNLKEQGKIEKQLEKEKGE